MKPFRLLIIALLCAVVGAAGTVLGQEQKAGTEKKAQPGMDEMMKKWQEISTPGAQHKVLEDLAGSWDTETKTWMNGPQSQPAVTRGSAECKMILGGRFLQQDMLGEMMGMPMKGIGLNGFDNFRKTYVGIWIDDTGTAIYTMEGTMDKAGKTITYWGKMDDPMTGTKDNKVKYTDTIVDKDKHIFRIYDVSTAGEKDPTSEITYTRKK